MMLPQIKEETMVSTKRKSSPVRRAAQPSHRKPATKAVRPAKSTVSKSQFDKPTSTRAKPTNVTSSKQNTVLGMLRQPEGTAIAVIMEATGWQQHSVRGFFAGVVRKKLGLNLISEQGPDGRLYRIINDATRPAKADRVKQAA
jgi:hypothetical protein